MKVRSESVRLAHLRLASAVAPAPLSILVSLIVVTGIAWALTLVICMSAPMGTAEHGAMVVEGMRDMATSRISAADRSFFPPKKKKKKTQFFTVHRRNEVFVQ